MVGPPLLKVGQANTRARGAVDLLDAETHAAHRRGDSATDQAVEPVVVGTRRTERPFLNHAPLPLGPHPCLAARDVVGETDSDLNRSRARSGQDPGSGKSRGQAFNVKFGRAWAMAVPKRVTTNVTSSFPSHRRIVGWPIVGCLGRLAGQLIDCGTRPEWSQTWFRRQGLPMPQELLL